MNTLDKETFYAVALTRLSNFNFTTALALYRELGSAVAVYEHRGDISGILPECSPRLVAGLKNWDEALRRAEAEIDYAARNGIDILTMADIRYPRRLVECADAPLVLYYKGTADLNCAKVLSVVGTRKCTPYGGDLIRSLIMGLREYSRDILIVSGLAYGVDVISHRQAMENGYSTVGVLAHGLDTLYPAAHRETASAMVRNGGLLTEFMTMTNADKVNFVRRNRIVAGMCDGVVIIESAERGGSLITADMAQGYGHDVFAFPGAVGMKNSEGCNNLIRDNKAALVTSAGDVVNALGWTDEIIRGEAKLKGIERQLFVELDDDERKIVGLLEKDNDLQANIISARTGIVIGRVMSLLFQLEMKGVVRAYAGGAYHLLGI